ncbi:MAG: hypothetical protein RMY34_00745 [Aulosira sp. DedQUE10]|nr:hypothetical protein [Aulosira sp. DedQUE10]
MHSKDKLKAITDNSGKQLLNGKHLQGKLMAKVANLLFDQFVKAIAKSSAGEVEQ